MGDRRFGPEGKRRLTLETFVVGLKKSDTLDVSGESTSKRGRRRRKRRRMIIIMYVFRAERWCVVCLSIEKVRYLLGSVKEYGGREKKRRNKTKESKKQIKKGIRME